MVTIIRWIRILEYFWLFGYLTIKFDLKLPKILNWSLELSLIWVSFLTWIQFLKQSSVGGLWYWLGERTFNLSTPGISKIDLEFETWNLGLTLRPYATFPHPNALAGFLLVAGLLIYYLYPKSLISKIAILASIITIPVTFSRTAIIIEAIFLVFLVLLKVKNLKLKISLLLFSSLLLFYSPALMPGNPSSIPERLSQYGVSLSVIKDHLLLGVGLGAYVPSAQPYYNLTTVPYNLTLQPVHNVFLLLISELGIPAFLIMCYFMTRLKGRSLLLPVAVVLISGMSDHYWLTAHQNSLLLVILFSLLILNMGTEH
ncbi:MAG: hypothetical protein UX91_C0001G0106 [Candidatus Amesbacteria bacterium GW2011_GWB1_47_19]|nr:MAG: hypothetical protein UW51_C0001G0106 [Candidatus Amesbacteria bacterium GW2011_GWA1_44_24]KKU32118.1 MAG: hypothetical protein UX46_C0001G0105 [Candidatus Amesbacteria bacterium GW2011_GWC1_46_24]KKU67802.1 MAG: hypothetical protein UX91_C0001G0106 [Candidatus Amesbacteria bacterium GW2011_GWB1_47_19]